MKKAILILFLSFEFVSSACLNSENQSSNLEDKKLETYVYLCNSSGGKKYHYSRSCRGLSRCKASIIKVTLQEAQKRGKTLCGWED